MNQAEQPYLDKARESLAGAESELAAGRFNNAANRAYYASYQAAIDALTRAGIVRRRWGHDDVQAQFAGQLITRRKLFPSELRSVLPELAILRRQADYESEPISSSVARRLVRAAKRFVTQLDEQPV